MRAASIAPVHRACLAFGVCLSLATAACSDNGADHGQTTGATKKETCEGRGEPITLGMSKQSDDGLLTATLVSADPLPPIQGVNQWAVDITDTAVAGGLLLDSFTIDGDASAPCDPPPEGVDSTVLINIYMADHDHNLRKKGTMTSPGHFEFPPLTVTMSGYWEFTVRVEPDCPADENDHEDMMFGFCVQK